MTDLQFNAMRMLVGNKSVSNPTDYGRGIPCHFADQLSGGKYTSEIEEACARGVFYRMQKKGWLTVGLNEVF